MRLQPYSALAWPPAVVLRGLMEDDEPVRFRVSDAESGELLMVERTHRVASWLKVGGYRWRSGSQGVWVRPEALA